MSSVAARRGPIVEEILATVMKEDDGEKPLLPYLEAVTGRDWLSTLRLWNPSPDGSFLFF